MKWLLVSQREKGRLRDRSRHYRQLRLYSHCQISEKRPLAGVVILCPPSSDLPRALLLIEFDSHHRVSWITATFWSSALDKRPHSKSPKVTKNCDNRSQFLVNPFQCSAPDTRCLPVCISQIQFSLSSYATILLNQLTALDLSSARWHSRRPSCPCGDSVTLAAFSFPWY